MKKFVFKLWGFVWPMLLIVALLFAYGEYKLRKRPSAFKAKAQYIQQQYNNINVLILGSSHNQDDINPWFISHYNASNLAFAGQGLNIDLALLQRYIQLPKLVILVLEFSYHTMEQEPHPASYHRNIFYLRSHNINLFGRKLWPTDYSILWANPKLHGKLAFPWTSTPVFNIYGFETVVNPSNSEDNHFKNLHYDTSAIMHLPDNMFIARHKFENIQAFENNKAIMQQMLRLCQEKNIVPVLLMPPVFKNYYENYLPNKQNRRMKLLQEFQQAYPNLLVLDYEQDDRFIVTDFKNEDHLNPIGAEKLTRLLNDTLYATRAKPH